MHIDLATHEKMRHNPILFAPAAFGDDHLMDEPASPLRGFLRVIEQFRAIDPKFPIQRMAVFTFIASRGECQHKDIERTLGLPQNTVSMILSSFGSAVRPGEPGLSWVESFEDPEDRRNKRVRLTHQGKRIKNQMEHALNL